MGNPSYTLTHKVTFYGGEQSIQHLFGSTPVQAWRRDMASVSSAEGGTTNLGREPITASRSAYYAALAYAGYATGGLWFTVVVQALAAGWLLYLLLIRVWRLGWPYLVLASVALMSLTPLACTPVS